MESGHPCKGCEAIAVDHAIICPILGVIASNRHKAIRASSEDAAWQRLHGWAVNRNTRDTVNLNPSTYWETQGYAGQVPAQALSNGDLILGTKKTARVSWADRKATSAERTRVAASKRADKRTEHNAKFAERVTELLKAGRHNLSGRSRSVPKSTTSLTVGTVTKEASRS